MILKRLVLQHFRSYTQSDFEFSPRVTYIVGPNTSGKSNLLESIYLLSSGKSYRAESDSQMVRFGAEMGRVKGKIANRSSQIAKGEEINDSQELEVAIVEEKDEGISGIKSTRGIKGNENGKKFKKKYFVNGVVRSRLKFAWNLKALLFVPSHLDIIVGSPSLRRNFFDEVLELVDHDYRHAALHYEKAIRQRNALLQTTRETGIRNESQFLYWDNLVITHGSKITKKREEFVEFVDNSKREIADIEIKYDPSVISEARLEQYKIAEVASGVTLVGPHRDDFRTLMYPNKNTPPEGEAGPNVSPIGSGQAELRDVKSFGSRGEQRLVVLQLKLLQLEFIEKILGVRPLLLLDDIFSELDDEHIHLVMEMVGRQQTIITTTHEEFLGKQHSEDVSIIKLLQE